MVIVIISADEKMNESQCEVIIRIAVQTCLSVSLCPGVKYKLTYVSHILDCVKLDDWLYVRDTNDDFHDAFLVLKIINVDRKSKTSVKVKKICTYIYRCLTASILLLPSSDYICG